jgi:deoxycytidine triphosphate deaminase
MVLGDLSLWKLLNDLVRDPDADLVNPASIDVRIGAEMRLEVGPGEFRTVDLTAGPVQLEPGAFALVPTLEWLMVPNGYALELGLKASRAQEGYSLSSHVRLEPGWCGAGTMPLRNATRHTPLPVERGMRIAQIVVHPLDQPAVRPHRRPDPEDRTGDERGHAGGSGGAGSRQ